MSGKILILEDSPTILAMMTEFLKDKGFEVITGTNGEEGLKKLEAGLPDVIISDVLMPVMDGFQFYKELKKDEAKAQIPVLILTSRGKMEDTFEAVGVDGFIEKPFDESDLMAKIGMCIKKSKEQKNLEKDADKKGSSAKAKKPKGNIKKVLVAGNYKSIVEGIELQLRRISLDVQIVFHSNDVYDKALNYNPDLLIIEAMISDKPMNEVIAKIKSDPNLEKVLVLVYTYLDKENLGEKSVHQQTLEIQNAKKVCMLAGSESIDGYDESTFLKKVEKYL